MSIYDIFGHTNNNQNSNFSMNKAYEELQTLKNNQLKEQRNELRTPNFNRLEDYTKDMPVEKVNWIMSVDSVSEKYKTMREKFNDYLWSINYKNFEDFCDRNNLPYCKDYVDSFINNIGNYVNPIEQQNKTIEELKSQIADLQSKKGGEIL